MIRIRVLQFKVFTRFIDNEASSNGWLVHGIVPSLATLIFAANTFNAAKFMLIRPHARDKSRRTQVRKAHPTSIRE
jgi:hypothetical protein